jgi:hypothetical protein
VAVGRQLLPDHLVVATGVLAGAVDQVEEDAAALHVAEEAVAEPGSLVGALDEAGNVGEHELALVDAHHPEPRMQRRERIVGDLRLG